MLSCCIVKVSNLREQQFGCVDITAMKSDPRWAVGGYPDMKIRVVELIQSVRARRVTVSVTVPLGAAPRRRALRVVGSGGAGGGFGWSPFPSGPMIWNVPKQSHRRPLAYSKLVGQRTRLGWAFGPQFQSCGRSLLEGRWKVLFPIRLSPRVTALEGRTSHSSRPIPT